MPDSSFDIAPFANSIFVLHCGTPGDYKRGTAFLISTSGLIVTAAHNIKGWSSKDIKVHISRPPMGVRKIIPIDEDRDIAILQLDKNQELTNFALLPVNWDSMQNVRQLKGRIVEIIGYPGNEGTNSLTIWKGCIDNNTPIVDTIDEDENGNEVIRRRLKIKIFTGINNLGGMSGSPIIDLEERKVIGVLVSWNKLENEVYGELFTEDKPLIDRQQVPVISVMGAKGGVGKTIFCARTAELIAETGKSVLIIDLDIENAGSTALHKERTKYGLSVVKSVYDHFAPHSEGFEMHIVRGKNSLWDVTPQYSEENHLGKVYLIPAIGENDSEGWNVIANIKSKTRNEILEKTIDEIAARSELGDNVGCIILDCGAGTNPLYSAALFYGKYPVIIATPEDVCLNQIGIIKRDLIKRFPKAAVENLNIILNQVRDQSEVERKWYQQHPKGYIKESKDLRDDYHKSSINFEYGGYDVFSAQVRDIIAFILEKDDQSLIPDEYYWLKKWIDIIRKKNLANKLLSSKGFKRDIFLNKFSIVVSTLILLGAVVLFYFSMHAQTIDEMFSGTNKTTETSILILIIRLFSLLIIFGMFLWLFKSILNNRNWIRRKKLLLELSKIRNDEEGELREFVLNVITAGRREKSETIKLGDETPEPYKKKYWFKPELGALKWLRKVMDDEIRQYRREERNRTDN